MKYLLSLVILLGLAACSKNPNNFSLQCYGQQSLAVNNQLTESKDTVRKYQFQNQSIPDHLCTTAEKVIQCSRIKDEGDSSINHYMILNRSLGALYETTITTQKIKGSEKKTKEIFQGKCESPIFS